MHMLTIQIAPANDESHSDSTLVDTFGVVCSPDNGVCHTRIDTHRPQKQASVLDSGFAGRDKHNKADYSKAAHADVTVTSFTCPVRDETDCDRRNCGCGVWRDRQELSFGALEAEACNDGWNEQAECIKCGVATLEMNQYDR